MADLEEQISKIAEKVYDLIKYKDSSLTQRRNLVTDMYGVEYTRQATENYPATFYISVTPDLVYLERFQFKLIIAPFQSTVGTVSVGTLTVDDTQLTPAVDKTGNVTITPNPHSHTVKGNLNITAGMTETDPSATDFRVKIEGIDITPYLMAQYDNKWITGTGIFPDSTIGHDYDILEVASDLVGEGRQADADTLLSPGYKKVEISGSTTFAVTLVLYLKLSHVNR